MATAFLPPGRSTWSARIKVWNSKAGKLQWKNAYVGAKTKDEAISMGRALELASGEVRDGKMTREKVERLVNQILDMAGFQGSGPAETLGGFGERFIATRSSNVSEGTSAKYKQHWAKFKGWAGNKLMRRFDSWTSAEFAGYYESLLAAVDVGTANDHLRTLNMIFLSAIAHQHVKANPLALLEKRAPERAEKVPISRAEYEKLIAAMDLKQRKDWRCLTRLGWHTGHRIQDLMSLTAEKSLLKLSDVGWCVRFRPSKKKGQQGREVVLPVPDDLAEELRGLQSFDTIHGSNNDNGKASNDFVDWLKIAGIDPMPIKKKSRVVHLKSFHSFRHSMTSRLIAAGVTGEVARLVTDHDSADVQKIYTHAEVKALAEALKKVQ